MFFSLRSRLMAAFSLLLIVPFITLVFVLSEESAKLIRQSIETSTSQTIEQFGSHVNTSMTQVEEIGNQVMSNRVTQQWITAQMSPDSTAEERLLAKQELMGYVSSYSINNSSGISIGVFSDFTGGVWTQDRTYLERDWYNRFLDGDKRWTEAHSDPDQADTIMKARLVNSFLLPLVQLQSFTKSGFVKINYPTSVLRDAIEKIRFGKTGQAFLLTSDGSSVLDQKLPENSLMILSTGLTEIKAAKTYETSGVFPIQRDAETYLLFYRYFEEQDWYVIGEVPEKELFVKIEQIRRTMLFISLILLLLIILIAYWLSSGITKPLTSMARAMKHVERGEFAQAFSIMPKVRTGHSEVGYVTRVFENMTTRLRFLIETEFETNLRRKNAEYKALLLQINPHFFNNTLEIIGGLAAVKKNDVLMDATEALGQMMRYSLNLNSDLVKVKEEMNYIRDYLFILQLRYEDRLQVDIEEDLAVSSLLIAKFILQPIVENAVKYSFEESGVARISLRVKREQDRLCMSVADNGIGMDADLVEHLMKELSAADSIDILNSGGDSIGLRNVLSRCRLYYGEQLEVSIDSTRGEGTEIRISIPAVKG
ncbi:two-component system sensor histidine kinase YesM [Paenibacillus castaneae]|uniref:cache domain-containing sensor histidine kinase n=1 Tax=Paenibacillus castaneae TaxID=474957 RepID=UPI000C9BE314|nr:histidine kinase [Paenibacillus castaneae]NIK74991.1 two-component system sensor histidine kinase YesM [Paenibacillus castaneae]